MSIFLACRRLRFQTMALHGPHDHESHTLTRVSQTPPIREKKKKEIIKIKVS